MRVSLTSGYRESVHGSCQCEFWFEQHTNGVLSFHRVSFRRVSFQRVFVFSERPPLRYILFEMRLCENKFVLNFKSAVHFLCTRAHSTRLVALKFCRCSGTARVTGAHRLPKSIIANTRPNPANCLSHSKCSPVVASRYQRFSFLPNCFFNSLTNFPDFTCFSILR